MEGERERDKGKEGKEGQRSKKEQEMGEREGNRVKGRRE